MSSKISEFIIIGGLAIVVIGVFFLGFTSKIPHSFKNVKPIYWGAIIALIAVIIGLYREIASSKKTDLIQSTGEKTYSGVLNLQDGSKVIITGQNSISGSLDNQRSELDSQRLLIDNLRSENAGLHKRLANISTEALNNLIGKDSYCYVSMGLGPQVGTSHPPIHNSLTVTLNHKGDYPISDLFVSVTRQFHGYKIGAGHVDREHDGTPSSLRNIPPSGSSVLWAEYMGTIPATKRVVLPLPPVYFESGVLQSYHFEFRARNGYWRQDYNFRYDATGKLTVTRTIKITKADGKEEKIIEEEPEPYWSQFKIG